MRDTPPFPQERKCVLTQIRDPGTRSAGHGGGDHSAVGTDSGLRWETKRAEAVSIRHVLAADPLSTSECFWKTRPLQHVMR